MIKIYCLYDPIECKVKYVGRTSKKVLEHRLREHISKAKYFEKYNEGKRLPHRVNWIKKILSEGREPKIKLLTEVEGWSESHQFERELIKKWKEVRDLVNLEDRGEGGINRIVTNEDKIKISNSLKEYYKTSVNATSKTVYVYNLNGEYLKSFESARKCSIFYKIPHNKVTMNCNSIIFKYKDWMFSYIKHDSLPIYVKQKRLPNIPRLNRRKLYKVENLITDEIHMLNGIQEIQDLIGINKGNISKYIKLYKGIYKGKYKISGPV